MTEILFFHHVQGLTPGVVALADALRAAGHMVHTPDLFEGKTFDSIADGMQHIQATGFGAFIEAARVIAAELPAELVYAGISFGVVSAQNLAQTRQGARGAVLLESTIPHEEFDAWPAEVPVQIHGMDADPEFVGGGDLDAARELVSVASDAELFLYAGDSHLFTDSSLPSYDEAATALVLERMLAFLARV
jgi:dienelactone hydrolase